MEFFNSAVDVLQTLVIALGAGLGIWGVINLLEGYGNDNPGAKIPGHEAAHGGRWCGRSRHGPRSSALQFVYRLIVPTGNPCRPRSHAGAAERR